MKIVAIKTHVVSQRFSEPVGMSQWFWNTRSSCLVEITTDNGITGWGECYGPAQAHRTLIESVFAQILIGRDPLQRVSLWDSMYNVTREWGRKGLTMATISGIDIALWDIAGKHVDLPIYQLLGGAAGNAIEAYASAFYYGGSWAGDFEGEAEALLTKGFRSFKMKVGAGPIESDIARVERVRDALGPDARVAVDANRGFTPGEAVKFGRAITDVDPWFFEEPVLPEDRAGYRNVRAALQMPIAGGESEQTRWGFQELLADRIIDIAQPDPTSCGGISETMRIAGMVSAHSLVLYPHTWGTAVAIAASLQVIAALPETVPSMTRTGPVLELDQAPNIYRDELTNLKIGPLMTLPTGPGLGIEVDRGLLKCDAS